MKTELRTKRKYAKRDLYVKTSRMARCGHVSLEGRYFKCEECLPELESDDGDLVYHQSEIDPSDSMEES